MEEKVKERGEAGIDTKTKKLYERDKWAMY
jgi:hypothetical protein